MKRGNILGAGLGLGLLSFAGLASAQEAAPHAAATTTGDGHASGLMVQARMQAQGGLLSVGGGPTTTRDRKSTRLNSSHPSKSRMPSSA